MAEEYDIMQSRRSYAISESPSKVLGKESVKYKTRRPDAIWHNKRF
jgi:hypothetical protein